MSGGEPRDRAAVPLLFAVFFASGFAALLYQVVWQRMLALFSGADVFSVTIVVSAFMAGLGLGSFAGGHVADRLSRARCLALFCAAELAIALFALVSKPFYYDVLYVRLGEIALPMPVLAAVLFLAVAWPTFFMGVSLPLLARAFTADAYAAGRVVGSLYGWNTLGAAAGAFLTTWLLLRRFDFESCIRIGAALNGACALSVLPLRRALGAGAADERPAVPTPTAAEAPGAEATLGAPAWMLVYALSGTLALSLEIAWFRVLGVMLKSTSFTFGTLLGIYLLGVGAGSVAGARAVARSARRPTVRFLALQSAIPLCAVATLLALFAAVDRLPALDALWAHLQQTEPVPIGAAIAALAADPLGIWTSAAPHAVLAQRFLGLYGLLPLALILPATFLMGLSFPHLQRAVQTDARYLGRRVGWLQTVNIAGSLTGSLVTGFVLLPLAGTPGTFRVLAALSLVFVALLVRAVGGGGERVAALAAGAAVILCVSAVPGSSSFWSKLHGVEPEQILVAEDAAGLSAIKPLPNGGHSVIAGGLGVSEFPYGAYGGVHTLLGALPVLVHPEPQRVAVIGLGSGETSYAIGARASVREVLTVEIIGSQLDVLRAFRARHDDAGLGVLLADPRFRIEVGDGRSVVRRDPRPFDVIEADALRPSSAYAGNLYSLEFFTLLRESLAPNGLAASWLPTRRARDTFVRSFPHVVIVEDIAIGSLSPISFGREPLLARSREPYVRRHFERVGVDLERMLRRYFTRPESRLGPQSDRSAYTDVNTDLFPKDEFLVGEGRPLRAGAR